MATIYSIFKAETEYDLAKALQQNDTKAQTRAYEKYSSKMLAICMRYVAERAAAEDVMIEGFMKIFDKINQFNFQGSLEGWMRKLMVNEALMYLRREKMEFTDLTLAHENSTTNSIDSTLEAEELMRLIEQLPTGYRTVFNLYAIEGYVHAEIAEMLGISEGTSKSQLSRARALLQEQVQREFIRK